MDERIRDVLAARMPGHPIESVRMLGAGQENVAYEINGDLVVRFAQDSEPWRVAREARLLAAVAKISPLPVPAPVFSDPEAGCLAYRRLPGVPLLELAPAARLARGPALGGTLGEFLAVLHAIPLDRVADLVDPDDFPLAEWRDDAAGEYAKVAGYLPPAYRAAVEAFLGTSPPADPHRPVFSHNDLGIEHVLVDPATWAVTGVIDWTDAAIVDPAYDLGLILRDLGPDALDGALRGYGGGDATLRERAVFYARCSVFEELAYGIATGRRAYADKSLAALAWLFPAGSAVT